MDGAPAAFGTESGKIELFSPRLAAAGFDPMPTWRDGELEEPPDGTYRLLFGRAPTHTFGPTTNNRLLSEVYAENPTKSIRDGAIEGQSTDRNTWSGMLLRSVSREFGIDLDKPWNKLPKKQRDILLHGSDQRVAVRYESKHGKGEFHARFEGLIGRLMRRHHETSSADVREKIEA